MMNPLDRLQHQAQRRAEQKVSQFTTGCFISALIMVLGACTLTGIAGYIAFQVTRGTSAPMAGGFGNAAGTVAWDGLTPLVCSGSQVLEVDAVRAVLASGAAIEASGNCRLTLRGVEATAPIALRVSGNAEVIVEGGSLVGIESAIVAAANAHVVIHGATVTGTVQRNGNARVEGI